MEFTLTDDALGVNTGRVFSGFNRLAVGSTVSVRSASSRHCYVSGCCLCVGRVKGKSIIGQLTVFGVCEWSVCGVRDAVLSVGREPSEQLNSDLYGG